MTIPSMIFGIPNFWRWSKMALTSQKGLGHMLFPTRNAHCWSSMLDFKKKQGNTRSTAKIQPRNSLPQVFLGRDSPEVLYNKLWYSRFLISCDPRFPSSQWIFWVQKLAPIYSSAAPRVKMPRGMPLNQQRSCAICSCMATWRAWAAKSIVYGRTVSSSFRVFPPVSNLERRVVHCWCPRCPRTPGLLQSWFLPFPDLLSKCWKSATA